MGAFAYDELASLEAWYDEQKAPIKGGVVVVGAGLGLAGGIFLASSQENQGDTVAYAMAGLTVGALVGGLAGSGSKTDAEWRKIFVSPTPGGVTVGYSTRF